MAGEPTRGASEASRCSSPRSRRAPTRSPSVGATSTSSGRRCGSTTTAADETWPRHFLGVLDGAVLVAVDVPDGTDPSDGAAVDLRVYHGRARRGRLAGRRARRAARRVGAAPIASAVAARTPTEPAPNERAMRCPACGLLAFPRLAPAMITLVTRGDDGPDQEALLARGVQLQVPMYSCLAGFVEPGESLEGAVVREVKRGGRRSSSATSRYRGSQPWPFPHSLMIGFRARYVAGEIELDPTEIARRRLVPARRPADHPAGHLHRPQAHRRLGRRRGCIFSVKKSRMISARIRRCTGEPERDSSWPSPGKR